MNRIIKKVIFECKKCVVGALYEDFDGIIYSFNLNESGLIGKKVDDLYKRGEANPIKTFYID